MHGTQKYTEALRKASNLLELCKYSYGKSKSVFEHERTELI